MDKKAEITSIFATTRNGRAVMQPTPAALKRSEGIPPEDDYPATHFMLENAFNRHFGEESPATHFSTEKRAQEFHVFCSFQSRQIQKTQKHYSMFTTHDDIPDAVLACCLNFNFALEIPLGSDNFLVAARDRAARVHSIWDMQSEVRQKDFSSLDNNNRFIFMDVLAKRLDVLLRPLELVQNFDDVRTSSLIYSVKRTEKVNFGDTVLAQKIHDNIPEVAQKYGTIWNNKHGNTVTQFPQFRLNQL